MEESTTRGGGVRSIILIFLGCFLPGAQSASAQRVMILEAQRIPLHATKSVAEWQENVASPDEETARRAIGCLAAYGREAESAIPTLRVHLASPQPGIRAASLDALVSIYRSAFEPDPDTREEEDLDRDLEQGRQPIAALLALESLVTGKSLPSLTAALTNSDEVVQYLAVVLIEPVIVASTGFQWGAVGEPHRQMVYRRWKEQADVCLTSLIAVAGSENASMARAALQTLRAFGWYDSDLVVPAVPMLIASLTHNDRHLMGEALFTLSSFGVHARDALPALMELAQREERRMVSGEKEAADSGVSDWAIRSGCLEALGSMRQYAVPALPIILRAMTDKNAQIRSVATLSLMQIGVGRDAISILVKNLQDREAEVRSRSAQALGQSGMHGMVAVSGLAEALSDTDQTVRFSAAAALQDLGPYARSALPALRERRNDDDSFVRTMVEGAITAIENAGAANQRLR